MKAFLPEVLMVAVQHFLEDFFVFRDVNIVFGLQMMEYILG